MELRAISMEDLPLYESLHCDPVMMAELGGPLPREVLAGKLRGIVESVEAGDSWYFKIVADEGAGVGAGTVCIWAHSSEGEPINEVGWMVLPQFQGRGIARQAVSLMFDRARSESRWGVIHAFPGIANAPSNAICRRLGFSKLEERDIEYSGRILRCNHWRIDLRSNR